MSTSPVSRKELNAAVDRLNSVAGQPMEPYSMGDDGRFHANAGNFHIEHAYGGYQLQQMATGTGGVNVMTAYVSRKELYNFVRGMLQGILFQQVKDEHKG